MAVSCAVYSLPAYGCADFPLLETNRSDSSIGFNREDQQRFLESEDFVFQDFNSSCTDVQEVYDQKPMMAVSFYDPQQQHQRDPAFTLDSCEESAWYSGSIQEQKDHAISLQPGFQPAFGDNYATAAAAATTTRSTAILESQDSNPSQSGYFDLWESSETTLQDKKDILGVQSRLVEWMEEASIATMMEATSSTTKEDSSQVVGAEEQYWFPCGPRFKCQVLHHHQEVDQSQHQAALPIAASDPASFFAFRQHCPAMSQGAFDISLINTAPQHVDGISNNFAMVSSSACSRSGANLQPKEEQLHFNVHDSIGYSEQEQQQQARSSDNEKPELPSRPTGRKCRMARKRRTLPYQVPFPCCTSRKSVEELISEKNLEFLLQKQLKPSDVGNLGRIVLPKKEAESTLPYLTVREGITIVMEDLTTAYKWHMRYRFWPNNKSRMYLLENTGEFIRSHCLKEGDLLRLYKYRDSANCKYVILGKKASGSEDLTTSEPKKGPKAARNKRVKGSNKNKGKLRKTVKAEKCKSVDSCSSSGSERDAGGLANFESFEASDIQEILTSLG